MVETDLLAACLDPRARLQASPFLVRPGWLWLHCVFRRIYRRWAVWNTRRRTATPLAVLDHLDLLLPQILTQLLAVRASRLAARADFPLSRVPAPQNHISSPGSSLRARPQLPNAPTPSSIV